MVPYIFFSNYFKVCKLCPVNCHQSAFFFCVWYFVLWSLGYMSCVFWTKSFLFDKFLSLLSHSDGWDGTGWDGMGLVSINAASVVVVVVVVVVGHLESNIVT